MKSIPWLLAAVGAALLQVTGCHPAASPGPTSTIVEPGPKPANRDVHGPSDVNQYIKSLESPNREILQHLDDLVAALKLTETSVVADIGAGPGLIAIRLARSLPRGLVLAVDIEPAQLDRLNQHLDEAKPAGPVVPVLAVPNDPRLPEHFLDVALFVDSYHHLDDRPAYLSKIGRALKPSGRLAIVDWGTRPANVGPPSSHTFPREKVLQELTDNGFRLVEESSALGKYQYFLIFSRAR